MSSIRVINFIYHLGRWIEIIVFVSTIVRAPSPIHEMQRRQCVCVCIIDWVRNSSQTEMTMVKAAKAAAAVAATITATARTRTSFINLLKLVYWIIIIIILTTQQTLENMSVHDFLRFILTNCEIIFNPSFFCASQKSRAKERERKKQRKKE